MKVFRSKVFLMILCFIFIAGVAVWARGKKEEPAEQKAAEKTETTKMAAEGPKPVYNWMNWLQLSIKLWMPESLL